MPDEKREDLVRVDERAVAVDGADAVAIAVGAQASVVIASEHSLLKWRDVRRNGLRVDAAEARISCPANFVAGDSVAREERGQ